ncbi:MAG: 3-ketoacyl-ACP reductase [Betaproteobacteria bacterium]|nr:MAG: 3-ketoacyl-ACP reductase [Betaproteobacteria bacterium]
MALALAAKGFDLALADLARSDELDQTANEVKASGAKCVALVADIADLESHAGLLDDAQAALGALDCLVNNAGVSVMSRGDLLDVSPESFDRCIAVNTRGSFFLTQAFAKRLLAQTAKDKVYRSIITISSSNALAASIARGEYCVSKAGLSMASTLFSVRLADHGVGVFEVQPGFIETEMTAPSKSRYDELIADGLTVIRRWGQPADVAATVATLATGGLPYSAGQAVKVDGGLLTHKF